MIQKYRAWDKTNKKLGLVDGGILNGEFDHLKIFDEDEDDWQSVENFIIMQSTGLFDSSEPPKEIFEGDIIRLEVPNQSMCGTYEVRRANSGEWRIDNRTQGRRLYDSLNNITVIGNIYEHPFLLEGYGR